ncbi:MAG: hypothetical protein A3J63_04695 [Candidatus Moranbacteria bacterium RIFCSPHIGHO2_02_FULL_40_12b]|nr:MAG: hypothetical protein A3J63_04695 [Candidatus Moranbacteria bacterium RIFCSPHIGHO2_02_FULL_40_12b]
MLKEKSFWKVFVVIFLVISFACMAASFFYGLLMTFIRYSIFAAIAAFIVSIIWHKKRRKGESTVTIYKQ